MTSGLVGTGMTAVSSSATVTIVVTGDVSGDGKITITDVVKLQKSVVGSGSLSGAYAKAADINGDGKVTITDVVQAAQVTVGLHGQQRDHQQQRQQRGGRGADPFVFHRMFPPQPMVRWPTVTWAACTTSVMVTLPSPLISAALA